MKKIVAVLFLVSLLLAVLSSCLLFRYEWFPYEQPMTKWEAGDFTLYIIDTYRGLLVWERGDTTVAYDAYFPRPQFMMLCDRRQQFVNLTESLGYTVLNQEEIEYQGYVVASAYQYPVTEKICPFTFQDEVILTYQFPENEIVFRRTAVNLTEEDIPQIAMDESYGYCPIYSLGSRWVSDDGNITFEMEDKYEFNGHTLHRCPVGKVTSAEGVSSETYIVFTENDSRAYIGDLKVENVNWCYDTARATDIWECAYFEDHFTATVVTSGQYKAGTVLTFSRQDQE